MNKTIALLPGDGIGPEIIASAKQVLDAISSRYQHEFVYQEGLIGGVAIDKTGDPFPSETEKLCLESDAILFGAIGDPKFDNDPTAKIRPEQGLLRMRKALGLYANVRPIKLFDSLIERSPIKKEIINGVDFVVIRELIGGIYFGEKGRSHDETEAYDTCRYTKQEIERVAKYAFDLSSKRRKKLTLVDKANVLETSRLWRETVQTMSSQYSEVEVSYMFVDNASMQIIKRPTEFDVILTENMFGDILTDESSVITGSIGLLPSASIGERTSIYEPIHGSFPSAKGLNIANPIGTILSAAMMLDLSFGLKQESESIVQAVKQTLEEGYGTKDLHLKHECKTTEITELIAQKVR